MTARPLIAVLWLWILVPSVAHASSFALVLYPSGVIAAMAVTGIFFARRRKMSARMASVIVAALTGAAVIFLPSAFDSSDAFEYLHESIGEWFFFMLGFVPASLMGLLVRRIGAHQRDRQNT